MLFYILFILCVLLILVLKSKNMNYWKKRNIAQVDGTLFKFLFATRSLPEIYKDIYNQYPNEPYIGLFLGSQPALILKNLEDIRAVLSGEFQNFYKRGIILNKCDVLADNVLFIEDFCRWKIIRKRMSPAFTNSRLKNTFIIMDKCASDFVNLMENSQNINKFNALYTYTTATIGASVFGIDTQTKNTMESPFLDMARRALEPTFKAKFKFFIANTFPSIFELLQLKIFGDHEEFFIGVVKKVLENSRTDEKIKTDFINICLELQELGVIEDKSTEYKLECTDELIAAQLFFFFIAGADTTANTIHFTLLELSNNPNILARLHEEIDSVFKGDELTYSDLEKLQYLDMVISESMRKFPTIGLMQRKCCKSTVLPGNVKIDKDNIVIIPTYAVHRDEKYFPDPEAFDPERFAPHNISNIKKYSYLPFGEGNRICLGGRFARLQVKIVLARLLRQLTLVPQTYKPKSFNPSTFSIRDSDASYDLISRNK